MRTVLAPGFTPSAAATAALAFSTLVDDKVLDILSSDYIPFSLMQAVFTLIEGENAISLPEAVNYVSRAPAAATGLTDRGEIAAGRRADLVRVEVIEGMPAVRTVWSAGRRVI